MRKIPATLLMFFSIVGFVPASSARAEDRPNGRVRMLVVPFENRSGHASLDYLSWQLAEDLAERLESDVGLTVLNGQFPLLTGAQASVLKDPQGLLKAACMLAKERGATRLVLGSFSGIQWNWDLHVEVRDVDHCEEASLGSGDAHGDQQMPVSLKNGRTTAVVSTQKIQDMLRDATLLAFTKASVKVDPLTIVALSRPTTKDSYANIIMGRAVARFLRDDEESVRRKAALELAAHAVRIDPDFLAARRFYAFLLEATGLPAKARIHYEAVLADRPDDVRSLVRLGRIEFLANRADIAETYLKKAVAARPDDPEPRYWLGETFLKQRNIAEAVTALETVRGLEPDQLRARKLLAGLYADKGEYLQAAGELAAIVNAEPQNMDAAFALAASLREGGEEAQAITALEAAATRFPREPRFRKFAEYLRAPPEPDTVSVAGDALVSTIKNGLNAAALVEGWRASYQRAANDATLDLMASKKEACGKGRGAASALTAQRARDHLLEKRDILKRAAALVDDARKKGEWAFLTSDQHRRAEQMLADAKAVEIDVNETGAQLDGSVMPLVQKNGCDLATLEPATDAEISARNAQRFVKPPDPPSGGHVTITTEGVFEESKEIRFTVDNRRGKSAYDVILDGKPIGFAARGTITPFTARAGFHVLCLRGLDKGCYDGESGAGRKAYLHDGWSLSIRRGIRSDGSTTIEATAE